MRHWVGNAKKFYCWLILYCSSLSCCWSFEFDCCCRWLLLCHYSSFQLTVIVAAMQLKHTVPNIRLTCAFKAFWRYSSLYSPPKCKCISISVKVLFTDTSGFSNLTSMCQLLFQERAQNIYSCSLFIWYFVDKMAHFLFVAFYVLLSSICTMCIIAYFDFFIRHTRRACKPYNSVDRSAGNSALKQSSGLKMQQKTTLPIHV